MLTFMHLPVGKGRVTLAIRHDKGADKAHCALAFCSPKDVFTRKLGRIIAAGRLEHGVKHRFVFSVDETVRLKDAALKELRLYAGNVLHTFPRWAQQNWADRV